MSRSLTERDRIAIAERWTTALSSTGGKAINELAEVLDDNVRTTNLIGKGSVLDWFDTWPGNRASERGIQPLTGRSPGVLLS